MLLRADIGDLIAQLCFAFRRWNDIGKMLACCPCAHVAHSGTEDIAKELHRNTTEQGLTLLQYLTGREKLSEHILPDPYTMPSYAVVGASRGVGLEYVRQLVSLS